MEAQNYERHAVLRGGMNLLRCFPDRTIPTIVVSSSAQDLTFTSRFCQNKQCITDYRANPKKSIEDLIKLANTLPGKPVLFYGDDLLLLLISRNREQLSKHFEFLLPSPAQVEMFVDKSQFAALAKELSLPVPQTILSSEIQNSPEKVKTIPLPCLIKPNSHIGWHQSPIVKTETGGKPQKGFVATDPQELDRLLTLIQQVTDDYVIQEFIPGGEELIYSFHAYYNENSQPLAHYVGKKIRTYPRQGGESCYLELVIDDEVTRLGKEILSKLQFRGPVKLDFKKDLTNNSYKLLEINARYNLWHYLGSRCGINIPKIAYAHQTQKQVHGEFSEYKTGIKWLAFGMDLRSFVKSYHPSGDLTWLQWLRSLGGKKIYNTFAWNDPLPLIVSQARYIKSKFGL